MRIAIIDDEINSIKVTKNYLKDYKPEVTLVGEYTNPQKALEDFEQIKPDAVLLDIEMPQMNGFEFLEQLNLDGLKIIFITAYDRYAIRAIKCSAIDYILKPFGFGELKEALDKAQDTLKNGDLRSEALQSTDRRDFLVITGVSEYKKISFSSIVYAEGQRGGYTTFYLSNGEQSVASKPLAYYGDVLDDDSFMKIHKSHIINLDRLKGFDSDKNIVIMEGGSILDLATRRRAEFIRRMRKNS